MASPELPPAHLTPLLLLCLLLTLPDSGDCATRMPARTQIADGPLKGYKEFVLEREVEHYLGIPFGQPPINELRYRHARPALPWTKEREVTKLPPTCWQPLPKPIDLDIPAMAMWLNNTEMSEDCLYLNVWRPLPTAEEKASPRGLFANSNGLAVMVWIYGGGFVSGTSTLEVYNGAYLAARTKVVVVSMQYRLGPLGFLYLGTDEVPGNQGLMDQVLALRWVSKNIRRFGGDPGKVTLFGESAGAASVSLHLLSPLSQNLFSQAVMQSGTALCRWAIETRESARHMAYEFAEANGCYIDQDRPNHRLLTDCLRGLEPHTLTEKQHHIYSVVEKSRKAKLSRNHMLKLVGSAALFFDVPFKPVVDYAFLTMPPEKYIQEGHHKQARIMLGVNKDEGMFYLMYGLTQFYQTIKHNGMFEIPREFYAGHDRDPAEFVQQNLLDKRYLHPLLIQPVLFEYQIPTRALGRRYWTPQEVVDALDDMTGDFTFKCPVIDFAEMYAASKSDVYLYSFEQRTENVTWPPWAGVMHGYEIEYVFGMPYSTAFQKQFYAFTKKEKAVSEQMMRFWSNFAYTGDPNLGSEEYNTRPLPQMWPRYTDTNRRFIRIKAPADNMEIGTGLRRRQCLFWSHHMFTLYNQIYSNDALKCPKGTYTTGSNSANLSQDPTIAPLLLLALTTVQGIFS